MKASFDHMRWENSARTIATFYFRPGSRYRYEAGQYAVIDVPHTHADSRGTSRTMTLSSSPQDSLLAITMRIYQKRSSTYKQALLSLQTGDPVTFYETMGDLVLPLDKSIPLVFIAGGVGVASYTGMLRWLLQQRNHRNVTLHYAVAGPEDIVLQQPFDSYHTFSPITKYLYTPDFTSVTAFTGTAIRGRLTADRIVPGLQPDSLIYISGTERMVEDILHQLQDAGFSRQRIIFDYFDGYTSDI